MTDDDTFELSRRKALAGLGTIGVASAGAGLGTSAFFSDTETYTNNVLTAGEMDLVVDWEEHYSTWSEDETANGVDFTMTDPGDPAYTPFPAGAANPTVWVRNDDGDDTTDPPTRSSLEKFMDQTTLESYPDADNNRVQDDLADYDACADFAQLDAQLNPETGRGDGVRSANEDTVANFDEWSEDPDGVDAVPNPLINLNDVKPGDFGEATLSLHLCDNPGYIWMQGGLVEARENGTNGPEANDDDEDGDADEVSTDVDTAQVELLDAVQTMLWYDEDGDNVYEPSGTAGEVDVMLVIDRSGSMSGTPLAEAQTAAKQLVAALGSGAEIGLTSFAGSASLDQGMTDDKSAVNAAIDALGAGGLTNHAAAIDTAQAELDTSRAGVPDVMVILTDGNTTQGGDPQDEAADARAAGTEIFAVGFGSVDVSVINGFATDPDATHAYFGDVGDLTQIFGQISQIIAGEECFFQGSLRTLLSLLSTELGIPLDGNRATEYDEIAGEDTNDDGFVDSDYELGAYASENRDCFVASTTNAIGLSWWLPVDHANEIQSDSVEFNFGFYTEQCRHNDGAGQAPESTSDA